MVPILEAHRSRSFDRLFLFRWKIKWGVRSEGTPAKLPYRIDGLERLDCPSFRSNTFDGPRATLTWPLERVFEFWRVNVGTKRKAWKIHGCSKPLYSIYSLGARGSGPAVSF